MAQVAALAAASGIEIDPEKPYAELWYAHGFLGHRPCLISYTYTLRNIPRFQKHAAKHFSVVVL